MTKPSDRWIPYWPYCETCRQPFDFDPESPHAYCNCGSTEWGDPRPHAWIPKPAAPAVEVDEAKSKEWFENWFCTAYPGGGGRSGDASLQTIINLQGQPQYRYTSTEQAWDAWRAAIALTAVLGREGSGNG